MILSPDAEMRNTVNDAASRHGFDIQLEVSVHPSAVTEGHLDRIRRFRPDLLVIDFDDDVEAGCRLAARVGESLPSTSVVAASWSESREALVAAMRAGVTELLQKPVSRSTLDETLTRLRRRLGGREEEIDEDGRVVVFFGPKGGAGSTTVATNFAIHLHELTGQRTLLVDLDLELGEVAIFLGLEPRYSVVDLLKSMHRLDEELLDTYLTPHDSGLQVLAAPYEPRQARDVTIDHVREMIEYLGHRFPNVVVDVSNALGDAAIGAFEAADEIMVVSQVDVPSVRNIQRCRPVFDALPGGPRELRLVLNRFEGKGEISVRDLEEALGTDVFWTLSSDYDSVVYSINTGRPMALAVPSPCSREIRGLAERTLGWSEDEAKDSEGILSRTMGRLLPRRGPARRLAGKESG